MVPRFQNDNPLIDLILNFPYRLCDQIQTSKDKVTLPVDENASLKQSRTGSKMATFSV
jgi:hypothetical protein